MCMHTCEIVVPNMSLDTDYFFSLNCTIINVLSYILLMTVYLNYISTGMGSH